MQISVHVRNGEKIDQKWTLEGLEINRAESIFARFSINSDNSESNAVKKDAETTQIVIGYCKSSENGLWEGSKSIVAYPVIPVATIDF